MNAEDDVFLWSEYVVDYIKVHIKISVGSSEFGHWSEENLKWREHIMVGSDLEWLKWRENVLEDN
jgi:hypothetical protein